MDINEIEFTTGNIKPIQALKDGWELIQPQYWLILGITVVGMIIAGFIPFGIALGAAYCGIYFAIFRIMNGERAEFGDLFKGIEYFLPALIATLAFIIPIVIFTIFSWITMFGFFAMLDPGSSNRPPEVADILMLYGVIFAEGIVFAIVLSCIHAFVMFTYPLIIEHNLSGFDAFKLSAKAAWKNIGGVAGFITAEFVLGLIGYMICGIGLYFVLPIMFAGALVMYRQVFPADRHQNFSPPPPDAYSQTGFQN